VPLAPLLLVVDALRAEPVDEQQRRFGPRAELLEVDPAVPVVRVRHRRTVPVGGCAPECGAMDLLVAADDRTGALETAAALADHGAGPVAVRVWPATVPDDEPGGVAVIDLGTRALSVDEARRRAAGLPFDRPSAHKIDSTLRGNWAEELVARHETTGAPVLLVPALPELGRTCVGGVVLVHGEPVHEVVPGRAAGRHAESSRPAELLAAAGATEVVELEDLDAVTAWLAKPHGIAVADAGDADTVQALAEAWAG